MSRKKLNPSLERKINDIGHRYEYWRKFIIDPANFKDSPKAHQAVNYLLENLVDDIGEYSAIMAKSEKLININKFRCDDEEDYKTKVESLDKHRKAVHNAAIQKFGIINRVLAKDLELHEKIISPDNTYVGIYPDSPTHLYINPSKDIEKGVTQDNCRGEISQTMLALAYYFGKKNI
jgi:hypothetical protein